jgi:hypothetical protein
MGEVGGRVVGGTVGAAEVDEDEEGGVPGALAGGVTGGEGCLYTTRNQILFVFKKKQYFIAMREGGWRKILSSTRKKTCKKCFRKVSIFSLSERESSFSAANTMRSEMSWNTCRSLNMSSSRQRIVHATYIRYKHICATARK